MEQSFGRRLMNLRKAKAYTQEEVAERLNVSPQAVSKWETDNAYPDITLLLKIASLYEVTVDELLGKDKAPETVLTPVAERKDPAKMVLKIIILSKEGDKVKVNLPLPLIKAGLDLGMNPTIQGNDALKNIDFKQVFDLIEQGVVGKLVEVESADGDTVEILVE